MTNIKIPKNQMLWVIYKDENSVPTYIVTSDKTREWYYLYSVLRDGDLKRIGKNKTPKFKELES